MPRARKLSQPSNAAPRIHVSLHPPDEKILLLARARLDMTATDVLREVFDHAKRSNLPLMVELLELMQDGTVKPRRRKKRRHVVLRMQDKRLLAVALERLGMSATHVIRELFRHARRSRLPLMVELQELAAKDTP